VKTNETTTATATPGGVLCDAGNYQWVVNIGGVVPAPSEGEAAREQRPPYPIRGGLVVPLYVIVLALIGSAVSMTRRVPEYQRRAMNTQDPLTNVQAREYLVFEIMQVVSAPLIAVTVYYIVKPDTPVTSVLLGFGSGFASEPILLMIRNLVEKLSPAKPTEPILITVRINPAKVSLKPGESKQFRAEVLGSSNSAVIWAIDPPDSSSGTISQTGNYVALILTPEETLTITARSIADYTKLGSASVTVTSNTSPAASIAVKVNPASATLKSEEAKQFNAEVLGSTNVAVTWSIDPPNPADGGTIAPSGKYVAPKSTMEKTVTITARSAADPTKSSSATVAVKP
jgi:hypothetical protein